MVNYHHKTRQNKSHYFENNCYNSAFSFWMMYLSYQTGIQLLYELNADFTPVKKGGEYLDPAAAAEAIKAVANQGKK